MNYRTFYSVMENGEKQIQCTELFEVSSEKNGAKIIFATDDFFGVAENLLKEEEPVWKEGEYTDYGKWMDGWETRRKRKSGNDYVVIALAAETQISHICIDTSFFTGNFPPKFSLRGTKVSPGVLDAVCQDRDCKLGGEATGYDHQRISSFSSEEWLILIPTQRLDAGYPATRKKFFDISTTRTFTHLRLDIFPDGGIARLRVYGMIKTTSDYIVPLSNVDLVSWINGGACVDYSNAHYGHPNNMIKPGKATSMADGWETARRRNRYPAEIADKDTQMPGCEWAVFKLAYADDITIDTILVDTAYFIGNSPYSAQVEAGYTSMPNSIPSQWKVIVDFTKLEPDSMNSLPVKRNQSKLSHVRVTVTPDGGLSRLRIFGRACPPCLRLNCAADEIV